jgi:predicted PurR-regulated permease PerM
MDFLRNLFGNLTSGIIRLLVAVGIIAAVGYFIVRPTLDTANKSIDGFNKSFQKSFNHPGADLTDINKTLRDVNRQVEREIRKSFKAAEHEGSPSRLIKCIKHAHGDVQKIQKCTVKF